ncbi:MAG: Ig-like domain repeat protein [Acidobacteriaceae bacterium]
MRHACRLVLSLCLLPACPFFASAQSWSSAAGFPVSGTSVRGVTAGIITGVGAPDILVAMDSGVWGLAGDGKGGLKSPSLLIKGDIGAVVANDFTGGQLNDMIAAPYGGDGSLYLYANQGNGTFGPPVQILLPSGVSGVCLLASGDFNADGRPDLALSCGSQPGVIYVGTNDGTGQFSFAVAATETGRKILSIAAGDFDNDGHQDITVASAGTDGSRRGDVFWGVDGKTFTGPQGVLPADAQVVVAGDYDGDSRSDLLVLGDAGVYALQIRTGRSFNQAATFQLPSDWEMSTAVLAPLQRGKAAPSVRALDVVTAGVCNNSASVPSPCVGVMTNMAATDIEIGLPPVRHPNDPYNFPITVRALHGNTVPSGDVIVWAGKEAHQKLPLMNGKAVLKVLLPAGPMTLRAGYAGQDSLAWTATKMIIVGGPAEDNTLVPQFAGWGMGLQRRPPGPGHLLYGVYAGRVKPRPLHASGTTYPVSVGDIFQPTSPVNYGTAQTFFLMAMSTVSGLDTGIIFTCMGSPTGECTDPEGYLVPAGGPQYWVDGVSQGTQSYTTDGTLGACINTDGSINGYTYCDTYNELFSITRTLAPGTHTVTAQWVNATAPDADSPVYTWTVAVNNASPSLSLSASPSSVTYGSNATFTATVNSGYNPSGTVTFQVNNGPAFCISKVSGGVASCSGGASWGAGSYTIDASYSGDSNNNPVSTSIGFTVNVAPQTITFPAPASPVTYGLSPIALSATATSGLPVTFSVVSGPGTVSGSTLTITGAGTVVVAANQAGNAEYSAAPQVTQSVVVSKATPTISWATPAAITYGTALSSTQLNATSGGVAGTFAYSPASGTVLGAGAQTLSVTLTPTDSTDYNSASNTTSLTVNKATGVFTIASSANPSVYGAAVSITVSGPAAATGTITLLDGANPVGTGTLSNGVTTISVPLFAAGSHSLIASYPGDADFLASTSAPYTQVVSTAAVVISIASTVNPSIYGETVTFTFIFHGVGGGGVPTGTAEITDGVNNLGTLTLNSSGVATFTTSTLVAGTHSITAAYQGDSNYH